MTATAVARRRPPAAALAGVAAAWAAALVGEITGRAGVLHAAGHHATAGGPLWVTVLLPPFWVAAALFLLAWQVMIGATMLPSSMPMIRMFGVASARQEHRGRVRAAFLGGYLAVWTAAGAGAFALDLALHRLAAGSPWAAGHARLGGAAVLAAAGAFQFTPLKDACLERCRHPAPFLLQRYRRGARAAYDLGREHGLFCLGCCCALMLMMLLVGLMSLAWMAGMAAITYYEKAGRHGRRLTPVVGVALLAWSAATVAGAT